MMKSRAKIATIFPCLDFGTPLRAPFPHHEERAGQKIRPLPGDFGKS